MLSSLIRCLIVLLLVTNAHLNNLRQLILTRSGGSGSDGPKLGRDEVTWAPVPMVLEAQDGTVTTPPDHYESHHVNRLEFMDSLASYHSKYQSYASRTRHALEVQHLNHRNGSYLRHGGHVFNVNRSTVLWRYMDTINGIATNKPGTVLPWDYDFNSELFPAQHFAFDNATVTPDVVICGDSSVLSYVRDHILPTGHKIGVLLHFGDEFASTSQEHNACTELYDQVRVVLREYAYAKASNISIGSNDEHVYQLPLGYMSNMLTENVSDVDGQWRLVKHYSTQAVRWSLSRNTTQRTLQWSYIGGAPHGRGYQDRLNMLHVFKRWEPYFINQNMSERGQFYFVSPREMSQIYNDSKFVVIGRGWNTLDCFRAYEALISGAIPVIVGESVEIERSFYFNGDRPPFVFSQSWMDALETCKSMSNEDIDKRRESLAHWYRRKMSTLKRIMYNALKLSARVDNSTLAEETRQ